MVSERRNPVEMQKECICTSLGGLYLEKEIAQFIDKLAKKGGKGMKSKIVNEALRKVFQKKRLL